MLLQSKRPSTTRLARWSAAHPYRAIAGWLAFVVACLAVGITLGTNSADDTDFQVGEAGRAEAMAGAAGLQNQPTERILIRPRSGPLEYDDAQAAARDLSRRMTGLPEVASVDTPIRSDDGGTLLVTVKMTSTEREAKKHIPALLAQTAAVQEDHPALVVEETGTASVSKGVEDQRGKDLALSEKIALPVTLVVLLVVFGSVVMAGVPLLLAVTSIAASMGLAMVLSHLLPDAGVGNNVILLIGMAIGVDYTLFYLEREREERARSGGRLSPAALVEVAAATAGRTIVISGLAVMVCTATLFLANDVIFSSLATGTILVVAVSVVSSLTALPALLVLLGRRTERRAERRAARGRTTKPPRPETGRVWNALLMPATRHPRITLVVSLLVMLALAAPALGMKLSVPGRDSFSREIPAMQGYDRLVQAFPELRLSHRVVVRSPKSESGEVTRALTELGRRAQADPLYAQDVRPTLRTSDDGRTRVLELAVPHPTNSEAAMQSLEHLREDYVPATVGRVPQVEVAVSGDLPRDHDYTAHQNDKLPLVIGALLLLTFAVTAVAFRSVVLGLVGVLLNLLSAGAGLGVMVAVFQGEWAEGLLGFESLGSVASRVPLFLFVILFGLSMDYQMFVVSRIQEAKKNGLPTREAVLDGIRRSAKVVTSAALVMVTVFSSFVFLHLLEMKQMGFSLAAAVLLDAFVIRILMLPAILSLLGDRAWWPSTRPGRRPVISQG